MKNRIPHFKLKDAFSMYKKCKKCGFEICLTSEDKKATPKDWKYCPKCGFSCLKEKP